MTPEAYNALKSYVDFRELHGEEITGESPLIRDTWQKLDKIHGHRIGLARFPKMMDSEGIRRMLYDWWKIQGVEKASSGKRNHEFKSSHGFRKFFETNSIQVMNSSNVELLMGHSSSIGLKKNYYKPDEQTLLNDYLKAVNLLTINEENRLHNKVVELEESKDEIASIKQEHEREMRSLRKEMNIVKEGQKELFDFLDSRKKLFELLERE